MGKTLAVGIVAFLLLAASTVSSSGSAQVAWVTRYNSGYTPAFDFADAVAVDSSGNVYVTGSSSGANGLSDYVTIKYSSSGETLWVQRYNGTANSWDTAHDLALDASGNVYVTGASYGSTDFDYVTIKYTPSGRRAWAARYNGPANSEDWATAIAVDTSGNVYVTGYSLGSGTFYDYATVRYTAYGVQEWVARYNGPGNTKDRAWALAVDGSGNVYVTGDSGEGSPNLSDYVTVKYDASAVQQWVAHYHNAYDYATALALDASGNVYVTGYSYRSGTYYDYATVKYDPRGKQRWATRYHGGIGDDFAYALAVEAAGNVYVTGESVGAGTGSDYATVKYDFRGKQGWVGRYNGPGNASDVANDIAVDAAGNVYVTGESRGSDLIDDFATVKFNAQGNWEWVARYNSPENAFDLAAALVVDASGNLYVTGRSTDVGYSVITTIKYIQISTSASHPGTNVRSGTH